MQTPSLRPRLTAYAACLAALLCADATAGQTGEVALEGMVMEQACAVSTPSRSWWLLPAANGIPASLTRDVNFDLSIEVCSPHVFEATSMNLIGEPDEEDDRFLAVTRVPGAAAGIGIAVYDGPGNIIPPGHPFPDAAFSRVGDTRVSLPLRARYTSTGSGVTPGTITAHAVIAVEHY